MKDEKISLCVIAGNGEKYIRRFLNAFQPLADEIVVVRAVGCKVPDNTLKIAGKEFGAHTAEYHNKPGHEAWPHVDDFAAAREMAFSMGTKEWLLWADLDDLVDEESIKEIKASVDQAPLEVHCIQWRYLVPGDKLAVQRERLIRRGTGRWVSPIHEYLESFEGKKNTWQINAEFLHAPVGPRTENSDRNLRIIESVTEEAMTPALRFHRVMALREVNRLDDCRSAAQRGLMDPELESPERYELLMILSQLAPDAKQRVRLLEACAHEAPERREAWGELALVHLAAADPKRALVYADIMADRPMGRVIAWNTRRKYFGWTGVELLGMALRANGQTAKAQALEFNFFREHGAKISLLHATRGREAQAVRARQLWLERAEDPDAIEHIFAIDEDDESSARLRLYRHVAVKAGGGCVRAWNVAAAASSGAVLIQMSDDWDPPLFWDRLIWEQIGAHAEAGKEAVLQVSDGHRKDDLLCMAILTRLRWQMQGYIFHPQFKSMYSDNWFSFCAFRDGVVIKAQDLVFEHLHPVFGRGEWDQTYITSNAKERYAQGEAVMTELMKSCESCRGWFDFPEVYLLAAGLARERKWETMVEVGCAYGKSLIFLAQNLALPVDLHAVDHFQGSEGEEAGRYSSEMEQEFQDNIQRCLGGGGVRAHVKNSVEGAADFSDQSVDFVFLDAGHSEADLRADIAAWWPKIKPGGVLAGHDYAHSAEVRKVVDELFPEAEKIETCWWLEVKQ